MLEILKKAQSAPPPDSLKIIGQEIAPNLSHKGRKCAFTLAEVLITLGIIGVVTALTMSLIIPKLRHTEASVRLKKFYSLMNQMITASTEVNGPINNWNIQLPYETFYKTYFTPYIKHSKINNNEIYFADGTTMTAQRYPAACMDILFDTNGNKKPNKEGYDKFRFLICPQNVTLWCGDKGFCTYRQNTYKNDRDNLLKCCKTNCSGMAGLTCSALLEYDNWEFKKDYPY